MSVHMFEIHISNHSKLTNSRISKRPSNTVRKHIRSELTLETFAMRTSEDRILRMSRAKRKVGDQQPEEELERVTRFELATPCLGSSLGRSTLEEASKTDFDG